MTTVLPLSTWHRRSGLLVVQVMAAAVDGFALSTVVVYAALAFTLTAPLISAVVAGAAAVALIVAPLTGGLMDRLGLPRAAALGSALTALALVGYATTTTAAGLAASVAVFMSAQALSGAARQGLAVSGIPDERRLPTRARMHTLLNTGLGAGTVLGALLIAGGIAYLPQGYLAAASVSGVAAVLLVGHPGRTTAARVTGGVLLDLRDRRFARATALAAVLQLTMPILSVLLPVWVVQRTGAPVWTSALALTVNTVLVIGLQQWWSARLRTDRDAARSARWAAFGMVAMGALLVGAATATSGAGALLLVVAAVVGLTLGEVAGGAAVWRVALDRVPAGAEGRYQATYSMSASAARIVGPLLALPLVIQAPRGGWLILAFVMAAAALAVAALARGECQPATPRAQHEVPSTIGGDLRAA